MVANTSCGSNNATFGFGECELGVLFRDDDIAVEDHLGSSPEGPAIHSRNEWFVEGVSSRDGSKAMGHAGQFLLVVGDLSADTSVISFEPSEDDGESC